MVAGTGRAWRLAGHGVVMGALVGLPSCTGQSKDGTVGASGASGASTAGEASGGGTDAGGTGVDALGSGGSGSSASGASVGASGGLAGSGASGGEAMTLSGGARAGGGDGAPVASCAATTACNADISGRWTVSSSCLPIDGSIDLTPWGLGCAEAPVSGMLFASGTWRAGADGVFEDGTLTEGQIRFELAPSCQDVGPLVLCGDQLSKALERGFGFSVSCEAPDPVDPGVWCVCTGDVRQSGGLGRISRAPFRSGTYSQQDGMLHLTGEEDVSYALCEEPDSLSVTATAEGVVFGPRGSVVLTRQD